MTLASTGFGGCGLGTRDTLGEQAISRGRPHTRLNFEVDIFTELLGVMDRDINRLGRDILDSEISYGLAQSIELKMTLCMVWS